MRLTNSWIEEGIEIGVERGGRKAAEEFTLRHLRRRFGAATVEQEQLITELPLAKLEELDDALFDMTEVGELDSWLVKNKVQSEG